MGIIIEFQRGNTIPKFRIAEIMNWPERNNTNTFDPVLRTGWDSDCNQERRGE
jgi:hypothetical protein